MTENPNETFCSTQFYNQIKRELTNSPCTNDVALGFYNNGINVDSSTPTSQLTDSHLKYNVHIVLENLKRSVEKTYLHDNANNNNCGSNSNHTITTNNNNNININTVTTTNNNQNNYSSSSSNHINTSAAATNQTTAKFGSNAPTAVDNSQSTISKVQRTATNTLNNKAGENMSSPESDCNSNVHANPMQQLASSIASSHDFTHDNSDYQWFLDYK